MKPGEGKIFCVGFQKTGTSSLGKALAVLGYKVCGPVGTLDPDFGHKALDIAMRYTDQYDAFQDHPWPLVYQELDKRYPGSKFILTVRPQRAWIRSVVKYFGRYHDAPDREWVFGSGSPIGHERTYTRRYREHNAAVKEYFRDRPDDLLVMDFSKGEGWQKLCAFLDMPVPEVDFPHVNKRGSLTSLAFAHIPGIAGRVSKTVLRLRDSLLKKRAPTA